MLLASTWCHRRAPSLQAQLALAAELGFAGIGLLWEQGMPRPLSEAALAGPVPVGLQVGVLDVRLLAAADGSAPTPQAVVAAVRQTGAAGLLLHAGLDPRAAVIARAEALSQRVLQEGAVAPDDEAVAEFRAMDPLPREQALEGFLRRLSQLRRLAPGLPLWLAPEASPASLLNPDSLAAVFAEGASLDLGYWHDCHATSLREAAVGIPAAQWLDRFSGRCGGATLEDVHQGLGGQPPGTGSIDWALVREYLPRQARRLLRMAPSYPGLAVEEARATLTALLSSP